MVAFCMHIIIQLLFKNWQMVLTKCDRNNMQWHNLDCTWVRDLTVPMHLGHLKQALYAPYQNHGSPVTLPKFQMAPKLIFLTSSGSKKRSQDTHVWVRPMPCTHKECELRSPLLLHTFYIKDCPAALIGLT